MKRHIHGYSVVLKTGICSLIILINGIWLNAQSFRVFAVSDLSQVFEDGYKLPPSNDTMNLFGIRGEIISGQLVVTSKKGLTDVTIEISELKDLNTGKVLPPSVAEWNFVGTIQLDRNAPNQPVRALVRLAPAKYPDYLMEERKLDVHEKVFKPVWLTISVPETAGPGKYTGIVTVKSAQGNQLLPLNLRVYPITMPSVRHLKIVEWYNTSRFPELHGIKEPYSEAWFDMLKIYAENMAAHRQNVFRVPMNSIEIRKSKSNELEFDFSRFDKTADVFWNTGKMDYLETGFLASFGKEKWYSTTISLADFSVTVAETGEKTVLKGEEVIPYLLPAFESHLRLKGWLNKTYFHIQDEPSLHNALSWKEISSYMHHYAPDLRRMDAIETTYLLDEIEVAVPKLDALASWYSLYKAWEEKGNELWFYTVGIYQASLLPNKTIDMPVMDSRILHWLNYKFDATGYLHWGWNQWTEDPFKNPDIHIGDGWHVYPAKNGVLNSLRWEQMRNGIQDYEYFWMLENKIRALKDSLGSQFKWIDPSQRGKEIAGRVVMDFAEHSDDPAALYNAKMEVIRELMDFNTSPRIYIQTNPKESATFTDASDVEVFGWTEPGTKIVINGKEIPVTKQGLFLDLFQLRSKTSSIIINASNPAGSKEIVRNFMIKQ